MVIDVNMRRRVARRVDGATQVQQHPVDQKTSAQRLRGDEAGRRYCCTGVYHEHIDVDAVEAVFPYGEVRVELQLAARVVLGHRDPGHGR